jgi:Protein of unknown function (DUF1592)/Protein of unknown function (DUF1588)/Protein of unknown function (DUF1585)/Protein of unknown function (DUF1595)
MTQLQAPLCARIAVVGIAALAVIVAGCAAHGVAVPGTPPPARIAAVPAKAAPPQDVSRALRVTLLSQDQYFNLLEYLFGPDIRSVGAHFAPFLRTDGLLQTGAYSAGVSAGQLEEFQRTASAVAARVVSPEDRDFLIPCKPAVATRADPACARRFLGATGRLLFRRPLDRPELDGFVAQAGEGADRLKDFYAGLSEALEGMLMAPQALFVIDQAEPDPEHPGQWRLDGYSLATRLSLLLWNSPPDAQLLRAAEHGELSTPRGRAKVVDAMLASPRLEAGVRAFFDDMFGFDDFADLAKDGTIYPMFNGVTAADAREQTLRTVVEELIHRDGDYRDLFTTRDTFISPALAAVYHVAAPPGWSAYRVPDDSPRVGILTQVSFLALHGHPGRSSPTRRGKALRELLLCQKVPNPPANVDFSLLANPPPGLKTQRDRLVLHRSSPACAGCHKITDPIGLALENFDGAGQFRRTENGAPIDASGSLDGKNYTDAVGLGQAVHDDPQLTSCLVRRTFDYATGGVPKSNEKTELDWLNANFAAQGYRFPALLRTVALNPAFERVDPATVPAAVGPAPVTTTVTQSAPFKNQIGVR